MNASIELTNNRADHLEKRDTHNFDDVNAFSRKKTVPDHLSHSFLRLLRGIKRSEPKDSEKLFSPKKADSEQFCTMILHCDKTILHDRNGAGELRHKENNHTGQNDTLDFNVVNASSSKKTVPDRLSHCFLRLLRGIKRSEPDDSEELFHQKSRLRTIFYHGVTLRRNHAACSG